MLHRMSDIAVILVAIVAIYAVATRNSQQSSVRQERYRVGQTISTLKGVEAKRCLLFAVSETCPHCQKMMPIYKDLLATARAKHDLVVAVTSNDTAEFRGFLGRYDVSPDAVLKPADVGLEIAVVPTTFVLEGRKLVAYAVGEMSPDKVNGIRSAL